MPDHVATCSCGQLKAICHSKPVRISICHCLECQKRTGSVFATNARFQRDKVEVSGAFEVYKRVGDSGAPITFHFCPDCGSTVLWHLDSVPDVVAVAVGNFADPRFPAPRVSVYERSRHYWLPISAVGGLEHAD